MTNYINLTGMTKSSLVSINAYSFIYVSHYTSSFKRIIKASSFINKKLCMKELIFFPKPLLLFIGDRSRNSDSITGTTLPYCHNNIESIPNPVFQRWNLHYRSWLASYQVNTLMSSSTKNIQILILRKGGHAFSEQRSQVGEKSQGNAILIFLDSLSLKLRERYAHFKDGRKKIDIVEVDITSVGLKRQAMLVASSNILIGLHGSGINALSIHLPIGTSNCCSVIELFETGNRPRLPGYRNAAQSVGNSYNRVDIDFKIVELNDNADLKDVDKIISIIDSDMKKLAINPTCILNESV